MVAECLDSCVERNRAGSNLAVHHDLSKFWQFAFALDHICVVACMCKGYYPSVSIGRGQRDHIGSRGQVRVNSAHTPSMSMSTLIDN